MTISFNHAAPYLEGKHYLTLANTDGQSVTVDFPIDPMSIDPIGPINADGQAQSLTFKGNNFVAGTTFEWRNPATSATATASGNATNISPKELTVNFAPEQRRSQANFDQPVANLRPAPALRLNRHKPS